EWIRIDLPVETAVEAVVLVCSQDFAGAKLWEEGKLTDLMEYHKWGGRALPSELTIQVSRDAWHWETVYEDNSFSGNDSQPGMVEIKASGPNTRNPGLLQDKRAATAIEFEPRRAKQILITGRN